MASLKEIQERLKRATKQKLQEAVANIVQNDDLIYEIKEDRLERGLRPNNNIIGTYKSDSYALFKQSRNPKAGGKVDLILSGRFVKGFYVESLGNSRFIFMSTDEKSTLLQEKYGKDIMGLNNDSWNKLQKDIYAPLLVDYIKSITGL